MQKDYKTRITSQTASETEEIEIFWTNIWKDVDFQVPELEMVRNSEEYRGIAPYLKILPEGARILDGGCGLGHWTLFLEQQKFKPTGLDLSKDAIGKLQELFPQSDFMHGDIRSLDCSDNSYDAYLSWGTFEHFENGMAEVVDEALRVLKPGGLLFITVPFDNIRHVIRRNGKPTTPASVMTAPQIFYQWRFTRKELRDELVSRGFEVMSIKPLSMHEGVSRMVALDLRIPTNGGFGAYLAVALSKILPKVAFAHMQLAIARKPNKPAS